MRELPKAAQVSILVLGLSLLVFLGWQIVKQDSINEQQQFLDQLEVQTRNPQEAGKNITN